MQKSRFRSFLKSRFDLITNEKIKYNILQSIPFWVAAFITGIVAVVYSKLFAGAEHFAASMAHGHKLIFFAVSPILFLAAYFLVLRFAPYARGSGIPQVISALELANPKENHKVGKLLGLKVIVVKIASSLLAAMGGAAIGREGPTIQIAGSIFRKVNQWIPASWPKVSRRNMIMTGASAGLAAAFNTPLGGIVFAVEELTQTHISYYRTAIFASVIIAGLTAQSFLGPYLYLGYPDVSHLSHFVLIGVVLVALATGVLGSLMCKVILYIMNWKKRFSPLQHITFVVVCSLLLLLISFSVSLEMLGSGKEVMNTMLFSADKHVAWYMPLLRIAGPLLSFTTGVAGGVFAPALSAGATVGAQMAGWFHLSPTDTNLIILSGMVGFLTGVTRTPFTSAILVLEMTDRHNVIFHLMLAGIVASLISLLVDRRSFYEHLKIQFLRSLDEEEKRTAPVLKEI